MVPDAPSRKGYAVPQPIVRIDPTRVSVEPGSQVTVSVSVYNPGTVVEGYDLAVLAGVPTPWATVSPAELSIYPQQEGTAVVTFAPPGGPGAPGGSLPFAVRAQSKLDPAMSAVAEGDLEVGAVAGLSAQLMPVTSSGRWRGRHTVTVGNVGNLPARLRVTAQDPNQALGFLVSPPVVDVPVRGRAIVRLKVRTRHPVMRGELQRLPFQVVCEPDSPQGLAVPGPPVSTPERPVVDGAFNQKPILTKGVVAVATVLVLALVGVGLYLLLKPDKKPEQPTAHAAAAPTGLTAVPSPGKMTLRWNVTTGVDSYELVQTSPVNDTVAAPPAKDPTDKNLWIVTLAVQTVDRYCYQVVAVRKDAPKSQPSDTVCAQSELTPQQSAAPSPTSSPTMDVITPSGTGTTGDQPFKTPIPQTSVVVPIENGANGLDLYVVDPDGTQHSLLGDVPGDQDLPSVSPDHTTVQYRSTPQVGTGEGVLPHVYQTGGQALPLYSAPPPPGVQCDGRLAWDPSTSNTGVMICFDSTAQPSSGGKVRSIYTATTQENGQVDGSTMEVVNGFPSGVGMSAVSVTATGGIVVTVEPGPSQGIWYLAPKSTTAVRLTSGVDGSSIAAPVGTLVAFQRLGDLMLVDTGKQPFACAGPTLTDAGTAAPLCRLTTDLTTYDTAPAWSWDGNTIVFPRSPGKGLPGTLMTLDPNNPTAVQPFAPDLGPVGGSPAWAPR